MDSNKTGADVTGLAELAAFLKRFPKVMVLSGAGMSTASGIPDYRDQNGIRRGKAPVQGPDFRRMEAVRRRYWARSMVGWPTLAKAIPNAGHHAIADMEAAGKISTVLTQNVDGLHQQAGSTNLIELHGNIHSVVCLDCGAQFSRIFIQTLLEQANPDLVDAVGMALPDGDAQLELETLAQFHIPYCVQCGGMLQPDVVFFGDGVPRAHGCGSTGIGASRCSFSDWVFAGRIIRLSHLSYGSRGWQAGSCNQSRQDACRPYIVVKIASSVRMHPAIAG